MSRGPVEFVVVEFPQDVPGPALGPELRRLISKGVIDLIDMVFVTRNPDGAVTSFEASDRADDPQFASLADAAQSMDGLIAEQDIAMVGAELAAGVTAAIFLFEHSWMRNLWRIVDSSGGEVVAGERISAPVVEAIEALAMAVRADTTG